MQEKFPRARGELFYPGVSHAFAHCKKGRTFSPFGVKEVFP